MTKTANPAAQGSANRALEIVATGKALDVWNPTENLPEYQAERIAIRYVMRRCHVGYWHAKTICSLSGLGGVA